MSTNYNRLIDNLDILELYGIRDNLNTYLDLINDGSKKVIDALYELSEKEIDLRRKRAISACVKVANFPFYKTIDDFDFNYQPSINKKQIEDFTSLRFMEESKNLIFLGSSGTGKTHLATAIGIEAAINRHSVYFISCQKLIEQLVRAERENRLDRRLKQINRYSLLIIDEIGYINFDQKSANLFFQLVSLRYEKRSLIITSNKNLSKWHEIFNDPIIANAILDRLLHHSEIVNIVGPSYRIKDILNALEEGTT